MKRASIIASILMIILGIGVIITSSKFKTADASLSVGPGFYPTLLAVILIILCVMIIYSEIKRKTDIQITLINKRVLYGIILIAVYAVIFEYLGFVISSIILMAFLCRVMGGTSWKSIGISSVLIPIGIYIVFNNFLQVPLPWGMFENFL